MVSYSCRKHLCILTVIAVSLTNSSVTASEAVQQPEVEIIAPLSKRSGPCTAKPKEMTTARFPVEVEDERARSIIEWANLLATVCPGNDAAILALTEIVKDSDSPYITAAAVTLGKVGRQNAFAVEALSEYYQSIDGYPPVDSYPQNEVYHTRASIAFSLGQLGPNNPLATTALIRILQSSEHYLVVDRAFRALGEVGQGNEAAITFLEKTIEEGILADLPEPVWQASSALGNIDPGNPKSISGLVTLFYDDSDPDHQLIAAETLVDVAPTNAQTVRILRYYLSPSFQRRTRYWAADKLGAADIRDAAVISTLLDLITTPVAEADQRDDFSTVPKQLGEERFQISFVPIPQLAAQQLQKIAIGNEAAINTLSRRLSAESNLERRSQIAATLGTLDPGNPQATTALITVLEQYESIRDQTYEIQQQTVFTAEQLASASPGNAQAISALQNLLNQTLLEPPSLEVTSDSMVDPDAAEQPETDRLNQYAKVSSEAAFSLAAITHRVEPSINALIALLNLPSNDAAYTAMKTLEKIAAQQPVAIEAIEQLLLTSQDNSILRDAADTLWAIDPGNLQAIATWLNLIQIASEYTATAESSAHSLSSIGEEKPEIVATLADIAQNHPSTEIRLLAAGVLVETNADSPQVIELIKTMLAQAKRIN